MRIDLSQCRRNDTVDVIHSALSEQLRGGDLPEKRLAPVRQFAQKLGVARQTMQKVYDRLAEEGTIARTPGKRIWSVKASYEKLPRCLGIILPIPFSEYFQLGAEYGQRHFRMYSGIIDRATELEFTTTPVLPPTPDVPEHEFDAFMARLKRQCSALIHLGNRGFSPDPVLQKILRMKDLAQVSFNCEFNCPNVGAVTFDPDYVAKMTVIYLREFGHRHICLVYHFSESTGLESNYIMIEADELKSRFKNNGVLPGNLSFMPVLHSREMESIGEHLRELLRKSTPPTAFWCRNDQLAFSLIRQLKGHGYRVPEDFSVIGFNNMSESEDFDPPLSTFNNPLYEMGQTVVNQLNEYLKGGITAKNRIIRVPPLLISRRSVGAPRSQFLTRELAR